MSDDEKQLVLDGEHLRLLAIFHYVSGGITVAFSLFGGVWLIFMGAMFSLVPAQASPAPETVDPNALQGPPVVVFFIFGLLFLLGLGYGVLEILAGRWISRRVRRVLTLVVAIPRLMFLPYGIILSIFTLLVLERRSVQQLYRPTDGFNAQGESWQPPPKAR